MVATFENSGKLIPSSRTLETVVAELAKEFPGQAILEHDPAYQSIQNSYWSGTQKDLKPRCFFQPHNATEVARAVKLCVDAQCPFGIKSGGHGHYAGQSCLDGGIQLDLIKLNTIAIDKGRGTAIVGAGCTWRSVYETLQKEGYIAVGGRSADVGVGGFMIGGGISFYAAQHGWGVDCVRSFEVILASGKVVRASRDRNTRLFRALRGGGSNFGVITAFELEIFPYSGMWGGRTTIDSSHVETALEAFVDFIPKLDADPKGHTIIIFDYLEGQVIVRQYLAYTQPIPDLPMFDRLRKVPTVDSSLGLTDYSDLAADIANFQEGSGERHAVSTLTVRLDYELLKFAYDTYVHEAATINGFAGGCLEFHALPRTPNPADNVYGLDNMGQPLVSIMLAFGTVFKRHDYTLIALQQRILGKIKEVAQQRGLYHPFLFANYAGPFQDVVGSYGNNNVKFLREVADEYDPSGVFQRLQPGGFKIGVSRHITHI